MRSRHAAVTVAALTAGLTASVALRRRSGRFVSAPAARHDIDQPAVAGPVPARPLPVRDGVVLPFVRPVPAPSAAPLPAPSASPARCGDTGGRTKTGAPCAARASAAGRCRHHQIAA